MSQPLVTPRSWGSHAPGTTELVQYEKKEDGSLSAMRVQSLPGDKPKILFHAAMMVIQNFGFFTMYYDIWGDTSPEDICDGTRFVVAFMAMTCFMVAFLCVGMGFGGYTDDKIVFALYWLLHLVGGACYTLCTILIPLEFWSDNGKECAALIPVNGNRLEAVYIMHAALYLVYVGGMLSITYFSCVKPTFFPNKV